MSDKNKKFKNSNPYPGDQNNLSQDAVEPTPPPAPPLPGDPPAGPGGPVSASCYSSCSSNSPSFPSDSMGGSESSDDSCPSCSSDSGGPSNSSDSNSQSTSVDESSISDSISGSSSVSESGSSSCSGSSSDCPEPPQPPPTCDQKCPCSSPSKNSTRQDPVDLATGAVEISRSYLQSAHGSFEQSYYQLYAVDGEPVSFNQNLGANWTTPQFAYLDENAFGDIFINMGPGRQGRAIWFELVGAAYQPKFGTRYTLAKVNGDFRLTDPQGEVTIFDGTTHKIKTEIDLGGHTKDYTFDPVKKHITEIRTTTVDGSETSVESHVFDYFVGGANNGQLQFVTLQRASVANPGSGDWTLLRRIEMEYYGADTIGKGSVRDLKLVHEQEYVGTAFVTERSEYYRHYTDDAGNGFKHGLKYIVPPNAYAGNPGVESETDANIATISEAYFEYDAKRRVNKVAIDGGRLEADIVYSENASLGTDQFNDWLRKAVYTDESSITKTVYSNAVGKDILVDDYEQTTGERWIRYLKFDDNAQVTEEYQPSSIDYSSAPYSESSDDLAVQIANSGLIELTSFYANDSNGGATGEVQNKMLKNGSFGLPVLLSKNEYEIRTIGSGDTEQKTSRINKQTVYRGDMLGGDPVDTEYSYTWHTGTLQVATVTTHLQDVESAEHGINYPQSDTLVTEYDELGRMIRRTDAVGTETEYSYDTATGAQVQMTLDSGTGGLGIVSDSSIDKYGRTIETLGPEHDAEGEATRHASWTVYISERETWTASGYKKSNGDLVLVNPISINRRSADGTVSDSIVATRGTNVESAGKLVATDLFPQSTWIRWSQTRYDENGRMTESRSYHSIPTSGDGALGTNYSKSSVDYDGLGRQNRSVSATGTITRTLFTKRNQTESTWIGTNDTGATETDPTGGGASGNNMQKVSRSEYDNSSSGKDGNVTKSVQLVSDVVADDRDTQFNYDWRNRRTETITHDGTYTFHHKVTLDNTGRATENKTYRNESGLLILIAKSESFVDDRGRNYKSVTHGVDELGNLDGSLESLNWFDSADRVVKSVSPGSELASKTLYDSIGRVQKSYQSYYIGTGTDNPLTVIGNLVVTQSETEYNDAGQVLMTTSRQRYHNAPGAGTGSADGGLDETPNLGLARVTYSATWYDETGRSIAFANYGTNGGSVPSRPKTAPASTDSVHVGQTVYDYKGQVEQSIDPADRVTKSEFDDLGRVSKTTQNFGGTDTEVVRTVYNNVGQMIEMIAENSDTGDQTTAYAYGITLANSGIANNDSLRSTTHPDAGVVLYEYDRAGQRTKVTDQNGTVHENVYDKAGRMTADLVTTVGTGIDSGTRRIERLYDERGRLRNVSSYSALTGSSIVNDLEYDYDSFGNLTHEYQEHGSAVDVASSPVVQYGYADGSNNSVRPTYITYPDGRQVDYDYGTAGGPNDRLGRIESLDDSGGSTTTYEYFGMGQVISAEYDEPDLTYSIPGGMGGYSGLDRFGRVVDLRWQKGTKSPVRFAYGYDRLGNRLFERNTSTQRTPAGATRVDALLGYDELNRLVDFKRGKLNSGNTAIASPNLTQDWTLDETGNWSGFVQGVTGPLSQTRTHNTVNEITDVAETSGAAWATPAHDANGNLTSIPQPSDLTSVYDATWDAWNRLVELKDGTTTVAAYQYDGQNRRVVIEDYDSSGVLDQTIHCYLSTASQVLEERIDSSTDSSKQFVWGLRFVDDLILRDRDTNSDGTLDERLYAMHDLRFSIVAVANSSGTVQERYSYDAYGKRIVLAPNFTSRSSSNYAWQFGYTGRRRDDATGLYFFRARYYSAELGRFAGRDPLGFVDGMSHYRAYFVPDATDPSGLDRYITQFDVCGIGGTDTWFGNIHVGVAVDTWKCTDEGKWVKTGTVTYDFMTRVDYGVGILLGTLYYKGHIIRTNGLNLQNPITFPSSPCQDRKMLADLENDRANPPFYSALAHNCLFWSVGAVNYGMDEPDGAECDCKCLTMAIFDINY